MGRQEQPIDSRESPLARFACELRELRRQAGSPPYRRLAAHANYSASTLAAAAAGHRLPSDAVLAAFVSACGGDPAEWEQRRVRVHQLITAPPVPPVGSAPPTAAAAALPPDTPAAPAKARPARSYRVQWPGVRSAAPLRCLGLLVAAVLALTFSACVPGDSAVPAATAVLASPAAPRDEARWLRGGTDIPVRYRRLIITAGTMCPEPDISPALVAAMVKAESGFDPLLSDPARDEYGIARWTPRVLRYYLPPDRQNTVPTPPFTADDSILAVGRMLCAIAPALQGVPGDPALNLAAAYRTATWVVQQQGARLRAIQPYLDEVRANLQRYRPGQAAQPSAG